MKMSRQSRNFGICIPSGNVNSDVTDLGATWVRRGLRWTWAESAQGVYDWTTHDTTVGACKDLGVSLLGVLSNAPGWAQQNANDPGGPIHSKAMYSFHAYCTATVKRYRGKVAAWEIWNEPQGNGWDAAEYANCVVGISQIIKAEDPDALVVGIVANGAFADAESKQHNAWYAATLSAPGVLDACDEISVHLYCRPYAPDIGDWRGPIQTRLDDSRDLLASLGWKRPLWATEGGWPTEGNTPGIVSEEMQAKYVVRLAEICHDRGILYFPFQLYGSETSTEAGGMGLIRPNGTRKPSFNAYRDWIAKQCSEIPPMETKCDLFLRPFTKRSAFNRPIGTGAQYADSKHAMTVAWNRIGFNQLSVNNMHGFNRYRNTKSDSLRTIQFDGSSGGNGNKNLPITVRAPSMRNPDTSGTEGDSPTILYDTVDGRERFLEFSRFRGGKNSIWTARDCDIIDPRGDGCEGGASASNTSGMMHTVRSEEINSESFGPIQHTITISINAQKSPAQLGNFFVWPARHTDSSCGKGYACDGPIPYGQLFALPPTVDINSLGLDALGKRIAVQMRDYGMYAMDNGGQNCRADQFVTPAARTSFINAMRIIKPLMRAVLNNKSISIQTSCSGGGTPIALNAAFDA